MNVAELTAQTREIVEQALNRLQVATLLSSELESQLSEAGKTIQLLSQIIESYALEQSGSSSELSSPSSSESYSQPEDSSSSEG